MCKFVKNIHNIHIRMFRNTDILIIMFTYTYSNAKSVVTSNAKSVVTLLAHPDVSDKNI